MLWFWKLNAKQLGSQKSVVSSNNQRIVHQRNKVMKKSISILSTSLAAFLLSACAQVPTTKAENTAEASPTETMVKQIEMNVVLYQCDQGLDEIEMRFFPQHGVAVLVLNGVTHELQEQRAASGIWYSNGLYTFRGKGNDGWLEIGRRAPINCQAKVVEGSKLGDE